MFTAIIPAIIPLNHHSSLASRLLPILSSSLPITLLHPNLYINLQKIHRNRRSPMWPAVDPLVPDEEFKIEPVYFINVEGVMDQENEVPFGYRAPQNSPEDPEQRAPLQQIQPFQQLIPATPAAPNLPFGLPPVRTLGLPTDKASAKYWANIASRKFPQQSWLRKNASHLDAQVFERPTGNDWRCLEYIGSAQDNQEWKFRYIHCVGPTANLLRPSCPGGCRNTVIKLLPVTRCGICCWLAALHEEDIKEGLTLSCNSL